MLFNVCKFYIFESVQIYGVLLNLVFTDRTPEDCKLQNLIHEESAWFVRLLDARVRSSVWLSACFSEGIGGYRSSADMSSPGGGGVYASNAWHRFSCSATILL